MLLAAMVMGLLVPGQEEEIYIPYIIANTGPLINNIESLALKKVEKKISSNKLIAHPSHAFYCIMIVAQMLFSLQQLI